MSGPAVPWNAAWSGEERFEVRPCRYAQNRLALWQPHLPGTGKPQFAEPHAVRQRKSIAEMRCTVCGERTPADDRWWFGHGVYDAGFGMWMTTEAPVHARCADHAMQVCPHLRKRGFPPYRFPPGASVLGTTIKPESLREVWGLSASDPVVGHLKLAWPVPAPPPGGSFIIPPLGNMGGIVSMPDRVDKSVPPPPNDTGILHSELNKDFRDAR